MNKAAPKTTDVAQYLAFVETTAGMGRVIVDQLDQLAKEIAKQRVASLLQPRLSTIRYAAERMINGKEELQLIPSCSSFKKIRRKRRRRKKTLKGEK
jgi:hypothetical protein